MVLFSFLQQRSFSLKSSHSIAAVARYPNKTQFANMKFASVFSVLASAATALATWENCPKFDATEIVNNYINILSHLPTLEAANATAQALLVENYSETSDSILTLEGLPVSHSPVMKRKVFFYPRKFQSALLTIIFQLDTAPFQGKNYYIDGIFGAPAYTGIETILIIPACGYITWHWAYTAIGSKEYRIKGFHLFQITDAGQLKAARLEFNSIAWGADTGYVTLFPGQNCTTDPTDAQTPLRKRRPASLR